MPTNAATAEARASGWRPVLILIAPHWKILTVGCLIAVSAAIVSLAQPLVVQDLIVQAQKSSTININLVFLGIGLVLGAAALQYVQARLMGRAGEDVVFATRNRLVHKLLRLPVRAYDHRSPGDLVSRDTNDTMSLRSAVSSGFVDAFGAIFTVVGAVIAMLLIDPILAFIGVGILLATALAVRIVGGHVQAAAHQYQNSIGQIAALLDRVVKGITTVRAFNATVHEEAKLLQATHETRAAGLTLARAAAPFVPMNYLSTQLLLMVVFAVGGLRVASGDISIAGLISFVLFLMLSLNDPWLRSSSDRSLDSMAGGVTPARRQIIWARAATLYLAARLLPEARATNYLSVHS